MPKVSVVDISDPNKIQEILNNDDVDTDNTAERSEDGGEDDDNDDDGIIPRLLFNTFSSLSLLTPLVSTHIALDILVHRQYAQSVDAIDIFSRSVTAAIGSTPHNPRQYLTSLVLVFLIGAIHPRKHLLLIRLTLFSAFLALGVAMIHISRDGSYYAVMVPIPRAPDITCLQEKQAPGIGTLVIFCAVELQLLESVIGLGLLGLYAFWHGDGKMF
jgi:hypothetical protein